MANSAGVRSDQMITAFNEKKDRYAYFLIAAAGTALGFSIQKTLEEPLSWWVFPSIMANLCWLVSIFSGCMLIRKGHNMQSRSIREVMALEVSQQVPPQLREDNKKDVAHAVVYNNAQFGSLISGVVWFVIWSFAQMIRNMP